VADTRDLTRLVCDRCSWPTSHGCTCTDPTLGAEHEANRRCALEREVNRRHRAAVRLARTKGWADLTPNRPQRGMLPDPTGRRWAS
jgi:hypothetical protein